VSRPTLEVADIFRDHGPAWREANRGRVSLDQLKVMSAIERCRTAALGGHVARCENEACGHTLISYNSCRNRHCPKCQGAASRRWLADREAELLPVPYFHVVYTLPSELRDIAYQNKRVVYDLLMKAAAETTLAIAADPKRLGARIGITAVLHTWGSALTHHPHVHMIVPGGGLSPDGARWIAARSDFLVHINVLARLFRGKMLVRLMDAHRAGQLNFFNTHAGLADKRTFKRFLAPLRHIKWVVYCKAPFAGPQQVLRYLSRYTHRVAISNRRLVAADDTASRSAGKTIASTVQPAGRQCSFTRTSSSGVSWCTCCPRAFTASATTGSSPAPIALTTSQQPAHFSVSPRQSPTCNSSRMLQRMRRRFCPAHARDVALA
jgi:predicted Zn-ribbon and HTH transcriptional regulator